MLYLECAERREESSSGSPGFFCFYFAITIGMAMRVVFRDLRTSEADDIET